MNNSVENKEKGKRLQREFPRVHFPYDNRVDPSRVDGSSRKVIELEVPEVVSSKVALISNHSDTRMHIVIMAGVLSVLQRYAGVPEVAVGSPVYKQVGGDEHVPGFFPISCRIDDKVCFRELVLSVNQTVRKALDHPELTWTPESGPAPDIGVIVQMDGIHRSIGHSSAYSDMTFTIQREEGNLSLKIDFDATRYEDPGVSSIGQHVVQLLASALFQSDRPIDEIDILLEAERAKILDEYNRTEKPWPHWKTLHGLVLEQVQCNPDRIALVHDEETLTYRELNDRADKVAQFLSKQGVVNETVVAIMIKRSIEMIVGILGILKSGGAYLPIGPNTPVNRATMMLEECAASLVLTNTATLTGSKSLQNLRTSNVAEVYEVDRIVENFDNNLHADVKVASHDLAYIMFTSGSTGKPKGVMLEHRNAVNTIDWFVAITGLNENSRTLLTYNYTSDPSVEDIFAPLSVGATLYITDEYLTIDQIRFREFVQRHGIHILNFVPRMIRELLSGAPKLDSLGIVLSGGEELEDSLKDELLQLGYTVYNNYGPTEAAIDCLSERCGRQKVTLGGPIQNMKCFIMNPAHRLVPFGGIGELVISGVGLARGYINQKELTDKKFIDNPLLPGDRMYLTGDMARWSRTGAIDFLGRSDSQVKIRGYRVELGEIEASLLSHPRIVDAVVLARPDMREDDLVICAYVVVKPGYRETDARQHLTEQLPAYMVPEHIVEMDRIPLNAVGKVDKLLLPKLAPERNSEAEVAQDGMDMEGKETHEQGNAEQVLAGLWKELLRIDAVSRSSNFFDLGGTSMDMIRLNRMIQERMGLHIPVVTLFRFPTIAALAHHIEEKEVHK